jgi:hypothetical protein
LDGWLLIAVLAAGCTASNASQATPSDQTDVGFMQHMAGHLLQTTAILDLTAAGSPTRSWPGGCWLRP